MDELELFPRTTRALALVASYEYPTGWKFSLNALAEGQDEAWSPLLANSGLASAELLEDVVDALYGLLGGR